MKKYLILLLMGILPYLSLAQNKVENSYLSITVPPGWHVQKQDMPGTKMELLNFFNDGPILSQSRARDANVHSKQPAVS